MLGTALHRDIKADVLAKLTTMTLLGTPGSAAPATAHTVIYLRGSDQLRAVAPGVGASEVFKLLRWQVLAPPGAGSFRPVTLDQIASLDPDILIFGDPRMRETVASSDRWRAIRAVHAGHAYTDPALPFGWIEEPPSINRTFGYWWLNSVEGTFENRKRLYEGLGVLLQSLYQAGAEMKNIETVARRTQPLPP
jgi:iron complex transport system substrate-binding protein